MKSNARGRRDEILQEGDVVAKVAPLSVGIKSGCKLVDQEIAAVTEFLIHRVHPVAVTEKGTSVYSVQMGSNVDFVHLFVTETDAVG